MWALDGLVACEGCGEPTLELRFGPELCDKCYREWLAVDLADEDDD